ncbi:hypothetical protein [Paenibacillus sp. GCM10027626]|uniref:hypothetical protein n=1 Tax=Paenibacillus sp. GCM10027626 TaxID=3273411 RepID=UPI00363689C6
MRVGKALLAASAVTILVTGLLGVLPLLGKKANKAALDVAVFQAERIKRISSNNLVDSLAGLQLGLPIRRADWHRAVLSVDLAVEGGVLQAAAWMSDLERLLRLAFVQTDNVTRVLVRFVNTIDTETQERASALVAAADIRRTDEWLPAELSLLSKADPFAEPIWRERLRLTLAGQKKRP